MAQTTKIVTFTAASPPILTAIDISNALQSAFPTYASFEKFIAVIHPDVTTIGEMGSRFAATYNLIPAGYFNVREYLIAVEGENVTTIDDYCFGSSTHSNACYNLASVDFPKVQTIGIGAFWNCTSLESVDFTNVEIISESAFRNCTSLVSVEFPSAETIGGDAFYNCTSLESVDLPLVETIGYRAFYNCTSLESITFGSTPPTFDGTIVFYNVPSTCKVYVPHNTTDLDSAEYVTRLTAAGFTGTLERLPSYTLTVDVGIGGGGTAV